jgi:hypothetical protein
MRSTPKGGTVGGREKSGPYAFLVISMVLAPGGMILVVLILILMTNLRSLFVGWLVWGVMSKHNYGKFSAYR